jgi:hypothetical protein
MKRFGFLAMALLVGLTMLASTAFAGDNKGTSYQDRNGVKWYANYGFDRGLRDGSHAGRQDAEKGYRFRAQEHGQFRSAMDGFKGGRKDDYKDAYRAGYLKGYKEEYRMTSRTYEYRR